MRAVPVLLALVVMGCPNSETEPVPAPDVISSDSGPPDTIEEPDNPGAAQEIAAPEDATDAPDEAALLDAPESQDDAPEPDGVPTAEDVAPCDCDDERACTDDNCAPDGDCVFTVADGSCLINNVCYQPGSGHPDNDCVACDPAQSQSQWSTAAAGTPCGDSDACLTSGDCLLGQCSAAAVGCDDANPCTDDTCHVNEGCLNTPNFDPCEDGDACTQGDQCTDGLCVGGLLATVCDDDQPCTNDVCGPDGCLFIPISGGCSDGTSCTLDDFCEKGKCLPGQPLNCDDGNICTVNACNPFVGCAYELVINGCCIAGTSLCDDGTPCTEDLCVEPEGAEPYCEYPASKAFCQDGDSCTGPDACVDFACVGPQLACDDGNPCTADTCVHTLGGCVHEPAALECDDGNACTSADHCIGGTCTGAPANCNDGEACTADACLPTQGCIHDPLSGECNDGDACTINTVCTPTGCQGGSKPCQDGNPCTNDSCHPALGCQFIAIGGGCDDNLDCSTGDTCNNGACQGDTSVCGCIPEFGDVWTKLTGLRIGVSGQPGEGLDIDKNPATCSPSDNCSAGIDNQLALFASFANEPLQKEIGGGGITLLFEHQDFKPNGQLFTLNFYPGDDVKGQICDLQKDHCNYYVEQDGIDPESCTPLITFNNAKIKDGTVFTAGGKGYKFTLDLPLGDVAIPLVLEDAQVVADVVIQDGKIVSLVGVLGGAVAKQTFLDGVEAIPEKDAASLPLPKEGLKQLIDLLIQNDVDTTGDGNPDAASIGLAIKGISGSVVGVK